MLFHVSEEPDIRIFEPRPSSLIKGLAVWAIDQEHIRNYLLPRDCPRVTFYAVDSSTPEDVERYLGESTAVVAIEGTWFERALQCPLHCYQLPAQTFRCIDPSAGYFISRESVTPDSCVVIPSPLRELVRLGVELRLVPNLWPLHDAVAASTLQFSMIRMRNASRTATWARRWKKQEPNDQGDLLRS